MQTLRLFCDLADCRSFSEAARRHGVTQSATSQRIRQLETRLGVDLVDRSVRPLALTPAGEIFARETRELLSRYDSLVQRVGAMDVQPTGEVRVYAIYSAGIDLLNKIQEAFAAEAPRTRVTIEYRQPDEVYEAVRRQRCDLGILSYPQRYRELHMVALRDEVMAVVCRPGHALADREQVQASELEGWPMVAFEAQLPVAKHVRRYLRSHGVGPEVVNVFDNVDTIKSAVAVTDAFAILPLRTVQREVRSGSLVAVRLEPALMRPMGIIYRRRSNEAAPLSPAAQAFVDYLRQHAGPEPSLAAEPVGRGQSESGASA